MHILGKLSTTNGCSISVDDNGLRGATITARLLTNDGDAVYSGPLRITKGKFINAPKSTIRDWTARCGRTEADFRGAKNRRNTVFYRLDSMNTYELHFEDLDKSASRRHSTSETQTVNEPVKSTSNSIAEGSKIAVAQRGEPRPLSILRLDGWSDLPSQPGVYWWYFPEHCITDFGISMYCDTSELRLHRAKSGKVCLYVGVATDLNVRVEWHADQPLTNSALKSGFLSTFRKTLLVLNRIEYPTGFDAINRFMDTLDITWMPTRDLKSAKAIEAAEINGEWHYPLNIQGNHQPALRSFIQHLKRERKAYTERFLRS